MAKRLTKKEKGFVKDYVKTDNATFAAKNNYEIQAKDVENVAGAIGSENLTKPKIIKAIAEMLPDELLSERHLELLNKREKVIVSHKNKDGDDVFEILDQPETQAVSKGLDMAYKIKSTYAPDKNLNVNITNQNIPDEQVDRLAEELIKRLKDGETTDNKGTSDSEGGK